MKKVGIIGASGYTGHELVKLLKAHPKVDLKVVNSRNLSGQKISTVYPDFDGHETYTNYSVEDINAFDLDLLFLAVPHGAAKGIIEKLDNNLKIIDLSTDHRFKEAQPEWVYGLPELFRAEITTARRVANPGCYATASILAGSPIQEMASHIIFDCKSGWSGAGRESKYAKDESLLEDNLVAYNLTKHLHKYEIDQFLDTKVSFTPHVMNTFQGMMCTAHIMLKDPITQDAATKLYLDFYADNPLIRVIDEIPQIRDTQGTSFCDIGGFEVDEAGRLVVVSTIDNLGKGAATQAVQNMNLMLGLEETEGLV